MIKKQLIFAVVLIGLLGTLVLSATPARAQFADINTWVDTVSAFPGDTGIRVPVYLTTAVDEISTFLVWFRLSSPEVCHVRLELDTAGTLISGWPGLLLQSITGTPTDIKVTGLCDNFPIDPGTGILPGATDSILFNLIVDVLHIPDLAAGRKVTIEFHKDFPSLFSLGDWQGNTIGLTSMEFPDSALYRCMDWIVMPDSICTDWVQVALPPYDSVEYFTNTRTVIDTSAVKIRDGQMIANCGDITGDGRINLTDVTVMVNFLFLGGDQPAIKWIGNVNGSLDNLVNLTDLTRMVNYLFVAGPPLECHHPNDD